MRFFVGHFKGNTKEERQKKILEISLSLSLSLSLFRGKTTRLEQRASKRRPHNNTGFLSVQKAVVVWVRAKRGVDFEAATTVPRERERAREIELNVSFLFFSSSWNLHFLYLYLRVRGKRRCARAPGSSSTSRRRAMMTKTAWELTEIGTISERNNEVELVLSSSFFFLSFFFTSFGCHFICEKTLFEFSLLRFLQVKQRRRRCRRITRANVNCGKS